MMLVVKAGGDIIAEGLPQGLAEELAALSREHRVVLVHGGGDIVTQVAERLGHPAKFVTSPRGFRSRYTDKETAQVYTMVMTGRINKEIVSGLLRLGVRAVGLSGLDGGLMRARRKDKLIIVDEAGRKRLIEGDYTGQVREVNAELLRLLADNGYVPVISPVAVGIEAEPLNVDGDRAAASVASALGADRLILLTDVEGVQHGGKTLESLHVSEAREIMESVGPGMITKLYAAVEAVEGGVEEAIIASGLREAAIRSALEHVGGTVIRR